MPEPLVHNRLGKPFFELQSVDSTNNYARNLLHEGLAEHGTAIFAYEQFAGKGQRGKEWTTEKGANIALSILINPLPLRLSQQFEFSACMALAVHDFFTIYAGNNTKIKWPNDLYYQDRKAGGILIENIVSDHNSGIDNWKWSIIGIGINVNQTDFPSTLQNPVSLRQITGRQFDPVIMAKELCSILNDYFEQLITKGFDNIYSGYLTHLYKRNETVKLKKGNRVFEAVIKGVSPSGQLITQHGLEENFAFGQIQWIIDKVG